MHSKTRNTYRNPQWEQQLTTNQQQQNLRLRFRRGVFLSFMSTKLSSLSIYSWVPAFHRQFTQLSRVLRYPMIRYSVCSPIQYLCYLVNSDIQCAQILIGPRREKTCLRGFNQSEFQTGLLSHKDYLEN